MSVMKIILFVYVASICIGLPFVIKKHKRNKNILAELTAIVFMPIVLLIGGFILVQNWWYKDKPRPIPKELRQYLRSDLVVVNGERMPLAEYNLKYKKHVTLIDVYGSKHLESVDTKEIRTETYYQTLHFSDEIISCDDTKYVELLGNAFLRRDFSAISPLMSEETKFVMFNYKTINGGQNIIDYWQDWILRCKKDGVIVLYTIKWCKWFSQPVLQISPQSYADESVLIKVQNNCISLIERIPNQIGDMMIGGPYLNWERLDIEEIRDKLIDEISPKSNHIVCLDCGTASDSLKWYRVEWSMGFHGYVGDMSVCPHCDKVIEFIPEMRLRYEKPIFIEGENEKNEDFPF